MWLCGLGPRREFLGMGPWSHWLNQASRTSSFLSWALSSQLLLNEGCITLPQYYYKILVLINLYFLINS